MCGAPEPAPQNAPRAARPQPASPKPVPNEASLPEPVPPEPNSDLVAPVDAARDMLATPEPSAALALPVSGLVPAPEPPPLRAASSASAETPVLGPFERHMAGLMSADEILSIVSRGGWTPARCAALGPVPDLVVRTWIHTGALSCEQFVRLSVVHWQPDRVLPAAHAQLAATFSSPGELLLKMPLAGEPGSPTRQAYAARALAALALFKNGIKPMAELMALPPAEACRVCGEAEVVPLEACAHGADVCADCVSQWMAVGAVPDRCPSTGCLAALTPNDAIRVGAGADAAQRLATRLAQQLVAQQPHWHPCGSKDCAGGVEMGRKLAYMDFSCGVCGEQQRLLGGGTAGDLENLQRMIYTYIGRISWSNAMLPCSQCGLPSEKVSGCSAVACPACRHRWTFTTAQVPKAGSMIDMGLFEGLKPGSVSTSQIIKDTVLKNTLRLKIFKELPQ